jgi:type 1 fimbria pilin
MKTLAVLAAGSLLILAIAGAASQATGTPGWYGLRNIDEVYHVIKVTGIKNDSCTFDIMSAAVKGKDGKVTMMDFSKPVSAEYFFTTGKIAFSPKERAPGARPKPVTVDYANASLKVAGASAVLAVKDITVLKHDRNETELQFGGLSVYLPDGTIKSYPYSPPVKVVWAKADMTATISGNPSFVNDLREALKGGATFPASAPPLPLKNVDAAV